MKQDGTEGICGQGGPLSTSPNGGPFASLAGGKSKQYLTINTPRGLQIQPVAFWSVLGTINFPANNGESAAGIPTGLCLYRRYLGDWVHQHREFVDPRQGAGEIGVSLNQHKCKFMMPEVVYLEHKISIDGLQPTEENIWAITDAPTPSKVTQLKSFLGMINYYGKFLSNLASTLSPLLPVAEEAELDLGTGPDTSI